MELYLGEELPANQNARNLFALRYDLYSGQFDRQTFVMVPKCGQLVVHFIQLSEESGRPITSTTPYLTMKIPYPTMSSTPDLHGP